MRIGTQKEPCLVNCHRRCEIHQSNVLAHCFLANMKNITQKPSADDLWANEAQIRKFSVITVCKSSILVRRWTHESNVPEWKMRVNRRKVFLSQVHNSSCGSRERRTACDCYNYNNYLDAISAICVRKKRSLWADFNRNLSCLNLVIIAFKSLNSQIEPLCCWDYKFAFCELWIISLLMPATSVNKCKRFTNSWIDTSG